METIKLKNKEWKIDTSSPLGKAGGFGEVFKGEGNEGTVAIKRLKINAAQAAHREMNIGQRLAGENFHHVVPIIDSGQDANSDRYYLVMPLCEKNLQEEIDNNQKKFSKDEIINILISIISGLEEVSDITHRDIKPANILFHEGHWKLADFGIAKFVEDSTSEKSLRDCLSAPYAAPEQWRIERPNSATDMYAVGCITHTLFTGKPPFDGDRDTIREKHLNDTPPPLNYAPPSIKTMASMMLRKSLDTRPSRKRCLVILEKALDSTDDNASTSSKALSQAVEVIATEQAKKEALWQAEKQRQEQRDGIYKEAITDLKNIKNRLFLEIYESAIDVMKYDEPQLDFPDLELGQAHFEFNPIGGVHKCDPYKAGGDISEIYKKQSGWNIVAHTQITLKQRSTPAYTRSANLIYAKQSEDSDYRWYELSFWRLGGQNITSEPYALRSSSEIDRAISVMDVNQLAHKPTPIDGEDEDFFIEYWISLISQAAQGKLAKPSRLPIER